MTGCLIWIAAFFYATFSRQINKSIASGYLVLLAIILWLSAEVLSAPTVRNGCKQIRVFQCLVLVILSCNTGTFLLVCHCREKRTVQPFKLGITTPRATATASLSNTNNVRTEDGAEERLPHPDLVRRKGDLEGGNTDDSKSGVELTDMAATDGAN
ncbi:hypothetical protein CPB84DRAFT_1784428 [Gymnopilus junonius]|uniref:Uncharacterized protein n=1 Tax=Gymnopilus junonius TaxID=109634 RepID=A0A9P5NJS7_GYMJU|nr:hypothetical protein CPB84DRAFT_1784428 [Gymnopilus junonius]